TSFLVDAILFTIINIILGSDSINMEPELRLLIATGGARLISSLVNYTMNRKVVFESKESVGGSMLRYYILCVCQAAVSYGLVYLFADVLFSVEVRLVETLIKFVVDMFLFFISFQIQQRWVFKK
ncbi:MAG: GtrA family protein, partial [Lachnospiraceae bacterium]|nr:GtrA family protein [Lachnospiraceae bacterium]